MTKLCEAIDVIQEALDEGEIPVRNHLDLLNVIEAAWRYYDLNGSGDE